MTEPVNPKTSEIPSEGNDEEETIKEAESSSKRSYECVYCKRGFTSAQALGGHMNIHRKDRANNNNNNNNNMPPPSTSSAVDYAARSIGPFPGEFEKFRNMPGFETLWSMFSRPRPGSYLSSNYLESRGLQVSIGSGSTSSGCYRDRDIEAPGSNLSLRVGPSNDMENVEEKGDQGTEEIDLELRLGRDP